MLTAEPSRLLAGRYRVETVLARGGMAVVYGATDLRLRRPVTVKMLRTERAADPELRDRFEVEARTVASLSHPNVVAIHDRGDEAGVGYLVMERLPGTTLADEIRAGSMSETRVVEVGRQVLAALSAAHTAGIVHGDVKPGNILTCEGGSVKVSDFGLSTVAGSGPVVTSGGVLIGTLPYMPPERLDGLPLSPAADIYSVGAVLYECLTGRPLFEGESPAALVASIRYGRPKSIRLLRPEADPELVAVIERALDPDADRRFASATAMSGALLRHSAQTGPIVLPSGPIVLPVGPLEAIVHREEYGRANSLPKGAGGAYETDDLPLRSEAAIPIVRARIEANWGLVAILAGMMLVAGLISGAVLIAVNAASRPAVSPPVATSAVSAHGTSRPSFGPSVAPLATAVHKLAASLPNKGHPKPHKGGSHPHRRIHHRAVSHKRPRPARHKHGKPSHHRRRKAHRSSKHHS